MTRADFIKEKLRKELASLKQGKCWVHGDKLQIAITEPFEGFPADHIRKIDSEFPFHALYVHVGCMPLTSNDAHGQRTSMCPACNKEASRYLDQLDDD